MHQELTLSSWLARRNQNTCHRQLLVVSGDENWGKSKVSEILKQLQAYSHTNTKSSVILAVGLADIELKLDITTIKNQEYRRFLGQESDVLIYNAWQGLRANSILALSGTLRYSGLMILVCPALQDWPNYQDPELAQRISFGEVEHFQRSTFIDRLVQHITQDINVAILTKSGFSGKTAEIVSSMPSPIYSTMHSDSVIRATVDQTNVVDEIYKLAHKNRRRSIIVQADRGRGKSSAIGMACAQIALTSSKQVIITAPNRQACRQSFAVYESVLTTENGTNNFNSLTFIPFDKLIENIHDADLLIIDEAAALPTPILLKLVQLYPRTVFSTTVHGYEGSGNGFELRFLPLLKEITPNISTLRLYTPVRWELNDPLELFWFNLFCYRPMQRNETLPTEAVPQETIIKHTEQIDYSLLSKQILLDKPALLKQVFELLINAHYQTTPDVLIALLDSPDQYVFIAQCEQGIIAAAVVSLEGNDALQELSTPISIGKRRVNGHVLPQRLAFALNQPELTTLSYARIVRIATNSQFTRNGVASFLLKHVICWAKEKGVQFIGATFGAESGLLRFWSRCGFELVHLGSKKETTTGLYTAMVLQPLNEHNVTSLKKRYIEPLKGALKSTLEYHYSGTLNNVEPALIKSFIESLNLPLNLRESEVHELQHFSLRHRTLLMTLPALYKLANCAQLYRYLTEEQSKLLISNLLQRRTNNELIEMKLISGKKQLEVRLAEIAQLALDKML